MFICLYRLCFTEKVPGKPELFANLSLCSQISQTVERTAPQQTDHSKDDKGDQIKEHQIVLMQLSLFFLLVAIIEVACQQGRPVDDNVSENVDHFLYLPSCNVLKLPIL